MLTFPEHFLWGVSTSAYQYEGGDVPNQWRAWERNGHIRSRDLRGRACDWWENAERDLDLCAKLGLNALRLSVEWARVEPARGQWDAKAIERYRSLFAAARRRGLRLFLTLHHFTHPIWFEERGAFTHPAAPGAFAVFAARAAEYFGEFCTDWVTFNEPNIYTAFGYLLGEFPPGKRYDLRRGMLALLGIHQAHAFAYDRLHAAQPEARVGMAVHYAEFEASSRSLFDRWLRDAYHLLFNQSSLHLLRQGELPARWWLPAARLPDVRGKIDWIGLNVYNRFHVRFSSLPRSPGAAGLWVPAEVPQGDPGTDYPYGEACPPAVRSAVRDYSALGCPMLVTENGVPDRADRIRPWVMVSTLREMHALIAEGFDLRGYFHWSLVDNFEWTQGWTLRFGLYQLDPATQERLPRPSAELFRRMVAANGVSAEDLAGCAESPPPRPIAAPLPALPSTCGRAGSTSRSRC